MIDSRFGLIIQARTNSTRFPNKIVRPVDEDLTFLDILLSRIVVLGEHYKIIVATTRNSSDDLIVTIAKKYNVGVFRGDEQNVLNRFVQCATEFGISNIIRVCSDNPYIDLGLLKTLVNNYTNEDYFSFKINGVPSILTHYGFFCEIVSLSALRTLESIGSSECLEHVTNCVYSNQDTFNVKFVDIIIHNTDIRCTLDTELDFEVLKEIYFNYYKKVQTVNYEDIIKYINKDFRIKEIMKSQIKQNTK